MCHLYKMKQQQSQFWNLHFSTIKAFFSFVQLSEITLTFNMSDRFPQCSVIPGSLAFICWLYSVFIFSCPSEVCAHAQPVRAIYGQWTLSHLVTVQSYDMEKEILDLSLWPLHAVVHELQIFMFTMSQSQILKNTICQPFQQHNISCWRQKLVACLITLRANTEDKQYNFQSSSVFHCTSSK